MAAIPSTWRCMGPSSNHRGILKGKSTVEGLGNSSKLEDGPKMFASTHGNLQRFLSFGPIQVSRFVEHLKLYMSLGEISSHSHVPADPSGMCFPYWPGKKRWRFGCPAFFEDLGMCPKSDNSGPIRCVFCCIQVFILDILGGWRCWPTPT